MSRTARKVLIALIIVAAMGVAVGVGRSFISRVGNPQPNSLQISADNPPIIRVAGDGLIDWLDIHGPLPEKMNDAQPSRIWKIAPVGTPPQLSDVPVFSYGQVPSGFVQEEPANGSPPRFEEGSVYSVRVIVRAGQQLDKTFIVRDGKLVDYTRGDKSVTANSNAFVPTDVSRIRREGTIHLIPINYNREILDQLAEYYQDKYGLTVVVEPQLKATFSRTYDAQRGQHVAQEFVSLLRATYPLGVKSSSDVYIGFYPQDMYVRSGDERYTYSYHDGNYAIVSDGRIGAFGELELIPKLRRIVTREIGLVFYHLPHSEHTGSVLYKGLDGPEDLEKMSEDF